MRGIAGWVTHWAQQTPRAVAVITPDGTEIPYVALADRVRSVAALLARRGVTVGNRVVFCGLNRVEQIETLFACAHLGAILVPINNRLTSGEVAHQLTDCRPTVAVAADGFDQLLIEAGATDVIEVESRDWKSARPEEPPGRGRLERDCLLVYTSGTTGVPKGAVITQSGLLFTVLNGMAHEQFTRSSVVVAVLPFFHVGGQNIQVLPCLYAGGTVVILDRFDPARTLELLARYRATHIVMVPAVMDAVIAHPAFAETELGSLTGIACGSSVVPEASITPFLDRDVPAVQVYGATETGPTSIVLAHAESHRIGSCGKAAMHTELRVVDSEGNDLATGLIGEIWLRGPNLFTHYWEQAEATAEVFVDGWYRTGDVGYLDAEGYVFVTGRQREVIVSGGENIYPAEVERILGLHPHVVEVAVVGEPDPRWGEMPVAYLVATAGVDEAAVQSDLLEWCETQLAKFKRPRRWVFRSDLPKTALGKVKKHELT
ncbi:MAG: long-chain fatty acid--CoA ligase [Actinomycetia bacterium]|nr:long-chain fatty acid--CoA ligase [Actinomycetes bacterium]